MAAAGPRLAPPPDGKDNLAPVEDLLNENPSHVALGKAHHNEPESDGRSEPTSDPTSTRAGSLWPSGGTCGRLWAPFGSLWGALGLPLAVLWGPFGYLGPPFGSLWGALGLPLAVLWGPFGHRGAQRPALGPGPASPWASDEKPKKTVGFIGFLFVGSPRISADGRRISADGRRGSPGRTSRARLKTY